MCHLWKVDERPLLHRCLRGAGFTTWHPTRTGLSYAIYINNGCCCNRHTLQVRSWVNSLIKIRIRLPQGFILAEARSWIGKSVWGQRPHRTDTILSTTNIGPLYSVVQVSLLSNHYSHFYSIFSSSSIYQGIVHLLTPLSKGVLPYRLKTLCNQESLLYNYYLIIQYLSIGVVVKLFLL